MYTYPHSYHALPHWKCVMPCCAKFPSVNLPYQETDDQYSNTSPYINFRIYHITARCSTCRRLTLYYLKKSASVNRIPIQNNPQKYTLEKS